MDSSREQNSGLKVNTVHHGDCVELMLYRMPEDCIDLTVTSPPYDDLRVYNGYSFNLLAIIEGLFRVTKPGGVVVWIVNDMTRDGSESGTSFKQALRFKDAGFNLHDTMIWAKTNPMPTDSRIPRYVQSFEYMFVFSKGRPKTCNHLREVCKNASLPVERRSNNYPARRENGIKSSARVLSKTQEIRNTRVRNNVWLMPVNGATDKLARLHPATFPERLANDHILSWSNPSDLVFDPLCGSGTTLKVAAKLGRKYLGCDVSEEYVELARKRAVLFHEDAAA